MIIGKKIVFTSEDNIICIETFPKNVPLSGNIILDEAKSNPNNRYIFDIIDDSGDMILSNKRQLSNSILNSMPNIIKKLCKFKDK